MYYLLHTMMHDGMYRDLRHVMEVVQPSMMVRSAVIEIAHDTMLARRQVSASAHTRHRAC